ncbi:hypothetical protein ACLB2K_026568 [Fragaria x ananassa]
MQYAQGNADGSGMFYCPCKMCKCRSDMHRFSLGTVWDHLKSNGFWERYTCWIYHGETSSRPHDHGQFDETGSTSNDPTTTFINDMFPHDSGVCPERQHIPQAPMQAVPRGVNTAGIAKYNRLIAFQQTPLCPGHEKTVLQCVMEVMHIKDGAPAKGAVSVFGGFSLLRWHYRLGHLAGEREEATGVRSRLERWLVVGWTAAAGGYSFRRERERARGLGRKEEEKERKKEEDKEFGLGLLPTRSKT